MGNNKIEYIIRIGPSDRYRHLYIKERGKIVFLKKTPIGAEIIFLPEFDQELKEYNLKLGKDIESEDGKKEILQWTKKAKI